MLVYFKSYYVQYRVKLVGDVTYINGSYTRFGHTIESKQAMLRFEYPSGVQHGASISYFSETPWPGMEIAFNSFNADGSKPAGY